MNSEPETLCVRCSLWWTDSLLRKVLRADVLYFVLGLFVIAFGLVRWLGSIGGPGAIWERFGLLAPAVSIPIQAVVAVTPFPSDVLCVANGAIYGFWFGALFSWIGWYAAAMVEFFIGRRARADFPVEQWISRLPKGLQHLPVDHPIFLIFSRFVPWAGGHISTLVPGVMGVGLRRFAWCAAIAITPPSLLMAGIGAGLLAL